MYSLTSRIFTLLIFIHYSFCLREFLVLADIHLDLNYDSTYGPDTFCRDPLIFDVADCQTDDVVLARRAFFQNDYGQIGCDLPSFTISTAFDSMKEYIPNPDFVIVLGDMVAHCQQSMDDLKESLEKSSNFIRDTFKETPIIPVIGNNDVFPHDSLPIGPSEMLNNLNEIWEEWIPLDQKEVFLKGGFYATTPVVGLRVIALNTLFYFKKWCADNSTVKPHCDSDKIDPAGQFSWLSDQLQTAFDNNEAVYLIGHVGPGRARGFGDSWKFQYQESFYTTISPYAEIIEGIFFAHIHRDSFSLVDTTSTSDVMTKMILFPSITPRSNSNPAYRTLIYEEDSYIIHDMKTYYFDLELFRQYTDLLPYWQLEYVFSDVYSMDVTEIVNLCSDILSDNYLYSEFKKYWATLSQIGYNQSNSHSDAEFYCMITTFFNSDYDDCIDNYGKSS